MTDEPRIYMRHYRSLGYCAQGIRQWYARHGFDYGDFLKNGSPISVIEQTGDGLATKACAIARKEAEGG